MLKKTSEQKHKIRSKRIAKQHQKSMSSISDKEDTYSNTESIDHPFLNDLPEQNGESKGCMKSNALTTLVIAAIVGAIVGFAVSNYWTGIEQNESPLLSTTFQLPKINTQFTKQPILKTGTIKIDQLSEDLTLPKQDQLIDNDAASISNVVKQIAEIAQKPVATMKLMSEIASETDVAIDAKQKALEKELAEAKSVLKTHGLRYQSSSDQLSRSAQLLKYEELMKEIGKIPQKAARKMEKVIPYYMKYGEFSAKTDFNVEALMTDLTQSDLKGLEMNVKFQIVDEVNGLRAKEIGTYYGPYHVHYSYPKIAGDEYDFNQIHRTCFNFKHNAESIMDKAVIHIDFHRFDLENGFDRVLIRHFNDSFVDIPLSFTGHHNDLSLEYLLEKDMEKSICVELQSDDSVSDAGIEFTVKTMYDLCTWSDWSECYMMDRAAMGRNGWRSGRDSFNDGKCGIGITSKHRNASLGMIMDKSISKFSGYLQDCNASKSIFNHHGGNEFCLKRKCQDFVNHLPKGFGVRYGWCNLTRCFNGIGRKDPDADLPDPFRLYLADKNNLFELDDSKDKIDNNAWFNNLNLKLRAKAAEIAIEHQHVNMLRFSVMDPLHKDQTAEYLGARVLSSLINGKLFNVGMTGDSVCSGHDNKQMNTYPMQLQSRLAKFWTENGNKGASFSVKNHAMGGSCGHQGSSMTQGFTVNSMMTETFPPPFSKLNDILDANYDEWSRAAKPVRSLDLESFNYCYTEGSGTHSSRELHMRNSAMLGAIWGFTQMGWLKKAKDGCQSWESIAERMNKTDVWAKQHKGHFQWVTEDYLNNMGLFLVNTGQAAPGSCPVYLNGTLTPTPHGFDNGQPPDGLAYAYTSQWMDINWHKNSMGYKWVADVFGYWILESAADFMDKYESEMRGFESIHDLDAFLHQKGGTWKEDILKSIADKKLDEWVQPNHCAFPESNDSQHHDYCEAVPFSLTMMGPHAWNTHGMMKEHFYSTGNETFDEYMDKIQWTHHKGGCAIGLDERKGAEGNMDCSYVIKPNEDFFKKEFTKWMNASGILVSDKNALDGFHEFVIANKWMLQITVKTPKYGAGRIKLFVERHCSEKKKNYVDSVKIYVNEREKVEKDVGVQMDDNQCIFKGLKADAKYVVSYVPYNITNSKGKLRDFGVDFIAAY